jgi:hypothetical protein
VSALGLGQGWVFIAILALQALTIHWLRDAVKSLTGRVEHLEGSPTPRPNLLAEQHWDTDRGEWVEGR